MSTPIYRLRYFFDPGSGRCLWADDDATRERFDYPIDHAALPLTPVARAAIDRTLAWHDPSLNWE